MTNELGKNPLADEAEKVQEEQSILLRISELDDEIFDLGTLQGEIVTIEFHAFDGTHENPYQKAYVDLRNLITNRENSRYDERKELTEKFLSMRGIVKESECNE